MGQFVQYIQCTCIRTSWTITAVAIFLLLYGQFSIGFVEVKVVIIFVGVNL